MSTVQRFFVEKWSNIWLLHKRNKKITNDFENELKKLIKYEIIEHIEKNDLVTKQPINMKYLVIAQDNHTGETTAFYTNWYQFENNYVPGMIVIDRTQHLITHDGETWSDIEEDNL